MIEARGTPRSALVQRYVLPRVTGQYVICDALLADRTPVTGRISLPPSFDGEGEASLRAMGVTAGYTGDVLHLCNGGRSGAGGAFSAQRVFGQDYAVPALDLGSPSSAPAPVPSFSPSPPPPPPPPPPVLATRRLTHLQPKIAVSLVNSLCEGFGGCSAQEIPGQPMIALSGDPEGIRALTSFLTDVDVPQPTYRLRATLFEVDRSAGRVLGLDLDLGTNVFALSRGTPAGEGAISLGVNYAGAYAAITAQEEQGNAAVLSQPELRLTDGQPSTFSSSTEVPTVSQIVYDEAGRQTQGIEYREAGLILNVTLRAAGETVELDLSQELSSFGRASAVAGNPSKVKRALRSTFSIPLGEPILIGGLMRDASDDTTARLPVLGWPLRSQRTRSQTDVYLLVQVERETAKQPPAASPSGAAVGGTEGVPEGSEPIP